jgi:DNA adenine methylase
MIHNYTLVFELKFDFKKYFIIMYYKYNNTLTMENIILPPFITRVGSKKSMKHILIPIIENQYFNTYIEPFVGGGSIFFGLNFKKDQNKVINDTDERLMFLYQQFAKGINMDEYYEKKVDKFTLEMAKCIDRNDNPVSDFDKMVKIINKMSNTFCCLDKGGIYKNSNPYNRFIKAEQIQRKLTNNTDIHNKSAFEIIDEYDNEDALFFLDPPYEKSDRLYKYDKSPIAELAKILPNIKGKFILTLNDSDNVRNVFKNFNCIDVKVKGGASGNSNIGRYDRQEIIITNFVY